MGQVAQGPPEPERTVYDPQGNWDCGTASNHNQRAIHVPVLSRPRVVAVETPRHALVAQVRGGGTRAVKGDLPEWGTAWAGGYGDTSRIIFP